MLPVWSQMQISGADPSTKQLVTLTKVLIGLTILLVIGVGVQSVIGGELVHSSECLAQGISAIELVCENPDGQELLTDIFFCRFTAGSVRNSVDA